MKIAILQLATILAAIALCTACTTSRPADGPGMIATFSNGIKGKRLDVLRARTSNGASFPVPGSVSPDKNPMTGGKTMGAAPDGRELPEWVEFEWTEWPYPSPPQPTEPLALQAWNDRVDFLIQTLPHKHLRVAVKSSIPQEVVDEVLVSNKNRAPRALPDKMLWVYFVWYESGIKFRWSLEQGCCKVLQAGGDDVGP